MAGIYTAFQNVVPGFAATVNNSSSTVPKAYLAYILFGSNYSSSQFGFQQLTTSASGAWESLSLSISSMPSDGYLYVFVVNESSVTSVYFDDMAISHTRNTAGLVVTQTNDYYPFGMSINTLSYQNQTSKMNDYKFGGKELQDEFSVNWSDFGARMYQADIGRWGSVDPMIDKMMDWSPYKYGYNNPVRFVDPTGMEEADVQSGAPVVKKREGSESTTEEASKAGGSKELYVRGGYGELISISDVASHTGTTYNGKGQEASRYFVKDPNGKTSAQVMTAQQVASAIITQQQTQGSGPGEHYPLDLTTASFTDIMNAFRYAHQGQGSNYYQDVFEFKGSLTRDAGEGGVFHTKNYKGAMAVFVLFPSTTRTLIDVVEPFYKGQPLGKQRGWGIEPGSVNTTGLFGRAIDYPYSIAIFAGGANSQSNERLATVFFSDLNMFKQWKAYVGN